MDIVGALGLYKVWFCVGILLWMIYLLLRQSGGTFLVYTLNRLTFWGSIVSFGIAIFFAFGIL